MVAIMEGTMAMEVEVILQVMLVCKGREEYHGGRVMKDMPD